MLVGFVHGVMNTDNMTISGETLDSGPCAIMDVFDPATVYSSIDHAGRYAYGNQPPIAQWNLARLAETLLPLFDAETGPAIAAATAVLQSFPSRYHGYWHQGMLVKLGVDGPEDGGLIEDLMTFFMVRESTSPRASERCRPRCVESRRVRGRCSATPPRTTSGHTAGGHSSTEELSTWSRKR
jgi:uncharacterized protein YdiU (UPF0061 family)